VSACSTSNGRTSPGEGVLPSDRLIGMCRWMGSHFHDWLDYNGIAFLIGANRVTRMGLHICGIAGVGKFRQIGIGVYLPKSD